VTSPAHAGSRMKVEWSKEDEERLRSLAMSGLSAAQIAAQIHRSKGSVRVRAAKLNIAIAREAHPMRKRKLVSARRERMRRGLE